MNQNLIEVKNLTFKRGDRVIYDNLNLQEKREKSQRSWGRRGLVKPPYLN